MSLKIPGLETLTTFSAIDKKGITCQINKLKSKTSTQNTDIPVRILKGNADFFYGLHLCFFLTK